MSDKKPTHKDYTDRRVIELAQPMDGFWSFLARFGIRRRIKNHRAATEEIVAISVKESIADSIDHMRQERLRTQKLAGIQAETRELEEQVKQQRLRDEQDEIEYRQVERGVGLVLISKAAQLGMDLPTYLEVVKGLLIQPQSDTNKELEQIKAAIKVNFFGQHIQMDMLRQELAGLYLQKYVLETSDSPTKEEQLKDIKEQIRTYKEDMRDRKDRLVEKHNRKDTRRPKEAEPADPDLRTGTKNDNEQE